jgi:selenocysteine lyase/cysteine desulfurase
MKLIKDELFSKLLNPDNIQDGFKSKIIGELKKRYFDYTASGLACELIEERMLGVLKTYANTHSKEASLAAKTSEHYITARENIKKHLGVGDEFAVLPCGTGATAAIKKFQEIIGIYMPPATKKRVGLCALEKLPLVIVGPYEHHSNEISYREAICEIVRVGMDTQGAVDLKALEGVLKANIGREIIGSFCIASNVTGTITPYREISKLIRQYHGIVCFDAASSSPYMNIDSSLYDAMFLSPHKLLGGPGSSGLLIIKKSLINKELPPTFSGGGTVSYVGYGVQKYLQDIENREDAGTPGILQFIRASLAYQLRNEVGMAWIKQHKEDMRQKLLKRLETIGECKIYGDLKADNIGIVSLNIGKIDPYTLCEKLSYEYGIQTRAGCSCAGPYGHDLLGLEEGFDESLKPGWLRISLHFSHTEENIDFLADAIENIVKKLN